jgi:hypothetical protein
MHNFTLPENAKVIPVLKPATDAAGRTGRYINLALVHKLYFVFFMDQGNAATVAVSMKGATSSGGAGANAIAATARIWRNLDVATSDTDVRDTDAASYTTDAALKEKQVIIEVPIAAVQAAGYSFVAPVTGASNAANLTACLAYIVPMYPGAGQPSATA